LQRFSSLVFLFTLKAFRLATFKLLMMVSILLLIKLFGDLVAFVSLTKDDAKEEVGGGGAG